MRRPGLRAALATAIAVVAAMFLSVGLTTSAIAAQGQPGAPPVQKQRSSKVRAMNAAGAKEARERVEASRARNDAWAGRADKEREAARWPAGGAADVPLGGTASVTVGGLPITLTPAAPAQTPATPTPAGVAGSQAARVQVFDRAAAEAAGVDGVLLTASAQTQGGVNLSIGYAAFASTYGGGWSGRLRLVQLPACALTTPHLEECRTQTPLESVNSATAQTLSAPVTLGAAPA
ncbi:hypothetical protein, partial [Nonomuraea sp. NPDC049784]|uniref:hypothetical protein n=1 Tax=Nonomuraea sp. NPDC049784 TaxID=3154361 RepID=UPI0033F220B4